MKSIKDQMLELKPPQPMEVWHVEDLKITLHSEKRENKKFRPVLVLSSAKLTQPKASIINIIPLTTSKGFDSLIFPLSRGFVQCFENFKPDNSTAALIQFYQPIEIIYFKKKCGIIDAVSYEAIKNLLCLEAIGYTEFDLSID